MHKWRRFRRLSAPEKSALIWALFLVPMTAAALRLAGFRRWKALLSRFAPRNISPKADVHEPFITTAIESARRTARMVTAASREGIIEGRCLENSVALWWLLLRRRLPAELHIGVRKAAKGFEAHAWVELFGTAVNDGEEVRKDYVPFGRDIATLGIEPQ